ncbi:MAG: hypothetical protein COA81_12735 [Alphaproteobacteria bacterium]|nr:MAG: hypothetical protein COA81_12735 [Alphaproteobacteria bacterium]
MIGPAIAAEDRPRLTSNDKYNFLINILNSCIHLCVEGLKIAPGWFYGKHNPTKQVSCQLWKIAEIHGLRPNDEG